MKTLIFQWNAIWEDSSANLTALCTALAHSFQQQHFDCVLLPELFHGGFSMHPERFAESLEGDVSLTLSELARQYSTTLIAGVAQKQMRRDCHGTVSRFFNRALAFDPQGQQIASYSKQKRFAYAGEDQVYQAGFLPEIVLLNGDPFALFICYDLRFPELFRTVAQEVVGVIVLANWPDSRQAHWQTLLQARAIENQCWVIGVNRTGQDLNGLNYAGGSQVISPLGEVIAKAGNEATFAVEFSPQVTTSVRQAFPFLQDMGKG